MTWGLYPDAFKQLLGLAVDQNKRRFVAVAQVTLCFELLLFSVHDTFCRLIVRKVFQTVILDILMLSKRKALILLLPWSTNTMMGRIQPSPVLWRAQKAYHLAKSVIAFSLKRLRASCWSFSMNESTLLP